MRLLGNRLLCILRRWLRPYRIGANGRLPLRFEQLILMIYHFLREVRGQFIAMFQCDRARWAGCLTVAAENTAQQVYVKDFCVTFPWRDAILFGILFRLNIDSVGGAGARAQVAAYASLQPVVVAVQDMASAKTRRQLPFLLRVRDGGWLLPHILEGGCQSLYDIK